MLCPVMSCIPYITALCTFGNNPLKQVALAPHSFAAGC